MALDRIAAGLAAPLAAREVGIHFEFAEPFELHLADHPADRDFAHRRDQSDSAEDAMAAPRQHFQAATGGRLVLGFRQNAAPAGDHGIGGENKRAGVPRRNRPRLGFREPYDKGGRQFAAAWRLVDIGRINQVRYDADLAQQIEPTRRGGSKHEGCHRHAC